MSDQRKKYTPSEKAKIALDAIKGELTLAQISSTYGVHSTQINAWKKQLLAYLPDAFNDKSKQQALTHANLQMKWNFILREILSNKIRQVFSKSSCYFLLLQ